MNLKVLLSALCLILPFSVLQAQQNKFRYKADVTKVDSDGVYKIQLQPRFTAKNALNDLSDIRLVDEHGRFIACSVVIDSLSSGSPVFIKFKEIKQETVDTSTIYIADVGRRGAINNLWLRLKNTEVSRLANLSGSDNLKDWFAIKEGVELQSASLENGPEYEQVINFPISYYKYYRLQINNRNRYPVKIIRSGIYITGEKSPQVKIDTLAPAKFSFRNGKQGTEYSVELDDKYVVDALKIVVTAPKYYKRIAEVRDTRNPASAVTASMLSSSGRSFVHVAGKTDKIGINILNGDDNPLTIKEIVPVQRVRSVVAYLEKGHKYYLLTGDSTANEVSYDLTFLHSKPMSQFPVINHSAVYKNPVFGVSMTVVPHRNFTPLLWGAIIIVLLILSLLTWRMVKELGVK